VCWQGYTASGRDLRAGQASGGEGLVDTQQVWGYELYLNQPSNNTTIELARK